MKSRFAPSPTGYLHIGGARTALFAWLWAKKFNGEFVLRIEDTDQERSTQKSIDAIIDGMRWLGLNCDEGPFYQTDRFDRYKEVISILLDEDMAYYCECSQEHLHVLREKLIQKGEKPKYDGRCADKHLTKGVVRFRNPKVGSVVFSDLVKGRISINNEELDDLIIARSDSTPTYNLTVVVDDHDMNIDYVIRGDDHINNTPKQINLYRALGWDLPHFAHLPMILGDDGSRLSKRHGAVGVMQYRDDGFLPEALLNYLVRLGWSHGDQEIFSIEEMIEMFELSNINKAPASFNRDKLLWLNQEYIKSSSTNKLLNQLEWHLVNQSIDTSYGPELARVVESLRERSKTLTDMTNSLKMFYQDFEVFDKDQADKQFNNNSKPIISELLEKLQKLSDWSAESILQIVKDVCQEQNVGFGKVGQPLRLALSGNGNAGSIDVVAELVGRDRTIARLKMALDYIINQN
jgi:glutamyl-tRNA synthetase